MNVYIKSIGIIDKFDITHAVSFKKGLNIITGRSSTGKSALIEIFDYCFGSSDFTIPEGVITKNTQVYYVLLRIKNRDVLLGRSNKKSRAFIQEFDDLCIDPLNVDIAVFNEKGFLSLADFKKELGGYFGIDITDTEIDSESAVYRKKSKGGPSIRSFMSYMLQHQNLIANKHAVFYRFDEKEKREQAIEHFQIFLGIVNQEYFLKSQKLSGYKAKLKKLELLAPRIDVLRKGIKQRIEFILDEYEALSGLRLEGATAAKILTNPNKWLNNIQELKIKVDSTSNKNTELFDSKEKELTNKLVALRAEERRYRDLCSSISSMTIYEGLLDSTEHPFKIEEKITECPLCNATSDILEEESNDLSEAVQWLHSELDKTPFVQKSYLSKKEASKKVIDESKKEIKKLEVQLSILTKDNNELKKRNSVNEQLMKVKLKLETYIEELIDNDTPKDLADDITKLKTTIKVAEFALADYDIDKKREEYEIIINEEMNKIGIALDFEKDYRPINLKFSLKSFDIWHEPKPNKKIFLRSMGSGANWLSTHIALFLGLQSLFCKEKVSCLVPPILFIDQPTQVYFPNVTMDDNKLDFIPEDLIGKDKNKIERLDDDIKSVENIFNEIISFCDRMEKDNEITPQIIITDHADHLTLNDDRKFENYVRARWRKRGFIDVLEDLDE
jgi:hypothetical protein